MPVQHRFDPKYLSHKFNSNGLKYKVGVCIQTRHIVWINGPFRSGFHDIDICRRALIGALDEDEDVEADGGYQGEPHYLTIPKDAKDREEWFMKTDVQSHHETANKWLKIFDILRKQFRHDLRKHSSVFKAIVVLTQLSIEHGSPLYSVAYCDKVAINQKSDMKN
eukprot:CCRYP_008812-RB/>CCRYP_008812-RB protein AED:0.16 eAED:0.09 QI:0/-1/0/1/-1/0/1/0/164